MKNNVPIFDIVGSGTQEVSINNIVGSVIMVNNSKEQKKESKFRKLYKRLFAKRKIE